MAPEAAAELGRKPVGTGPFRFSAWVPDTYISLERNPDYWEKGLPNLAGLKFNIVPEAATREAGIIGGTYKLLPVVDAASAAALAGKPGVKLLQTQDLAYSLVGLNVTKPPLDKPAVREAHQHGHRPQPARAGRVFRPRRARRSAVAGAAEWALPVSDFPCYKADAAGAEKKLQEAGLTGQVKLTLNVLGSLQIVQDLAQVVQAQLNKAGFDVALNVQEQGRFIADWRASNFEGFVSLNGGGPDPDDYFGRTYQTGGATNVFKYSNPEMDKLLIAARADDGHGGAQAAVRRGAEDPGLHGPDRRRWPTARCSPRCATIVQGFSPMPTRSLRTLQGGDTVRAAKPDPRPPDPGRRAAVRRFRRFRADLPDDPPGARRRRADHARRLRRLARTRGRAAPAAWPRPPAGGAVRALDRPRAARRISAPACGPAGRSSRKSPAASA